MKSSVILLLLCSPMLVSSVSCKTSDDCSSLNSCVQGTCTHKDLIPLAGVEWGGTMILIVVALIANAGGIGGSVICTSLMLSLFYFDAHQAVALTQSFIFAGSATSALLKIRDRHPTRDRPLIYYDVLLQISSPLLLGLSLGVLASPVFPDWLILASLTIVITYLEIVTVKQAIKLFKDETKLKRADLKEKEESESNERNKEIGAGYEDNKEDEDNFISRKIEGIPVNSENAEEVKILFVEKEENSKDSEKGSSQGEDIKVWTKAQNYSNEMSADSQSGRSIVSPDEKSDEINEAALSDAKIVEIMADSIKTENNNKEKHDDLPEDLKRSILEISEEERKKILFFPHISYFILLVVFSIFFKLLLSGMSSFIVIKKCSDKFYGVIFAYIIAMLLLNLYSSYYLIRKTRICEMANYKFEYDDIKWDLKRCLQVVVIWTIVGFLVGVLGLGGVIINPLLLFMGIRPEISTISSSFTIGLSAFTAMIQFYIAGTINFRYGFWLMGFSSFGAVNGILILRRQFLKINRSSLLIFAYCVIIVGSLVVIPTVGIMTAIQQHKDGNFVLGFTSIC